MTDKKRKPIRASLRERRRQIGEYKRQVVQNLRKYLENRTQRQRLVIIALMAAILLAVDAWVIVRGVTGKRKPEIEHIEPVRLDDTSNGEDKPGLPDIMNQLESLIP